MHRSRAVAVATAVVVLCAVGASSAVADAVPLGGSPLNVYVGERGQLQAFRARESNGIYFSPTQTSGDAGFFLADTDARVVNGFEGAAGPHGLALYNPIAVHPVTGTGTAADPLTQQTSYTTADTDISITQTTTYVNGSQEFRIRWDVTNTLGAGSPKHFKALVAADFFFDGSDRGTGIYTQGPPQFIGGTNADTGASGGFVEIPATSRWSAYQALAFGASPGEVWDKIENSAANLSQVLDDTVVGQQVDNAGAVEWDAYAGGGPGLDGGHTATFEIIARTAIPSALQLNPTNGGAPKGTPISFTATAVDTNGTPYAGKTLRYAITGANATSGATTLDASGSGVITDPGTNAGADTVIAFVDFNNNGTRDTAEPQASALGTFVDNVPPSCTVKVTGDRPGGSGGAGKPLVISVNCAEAATVTVQTSLQPPAARRRAAAATVDKKKKPKKPAAIKLKTTTITVTPGKPVPVSLKLSSAVRKKYAGKTLKATITVTARDASGNVKKTKTTRSVKLAKLKKSKAKKHKR